MQSGNSHTDIFKYLQTSQQKYHFFGQANKVKRLFIELLHKKKFKQHCTCPCVNYGTYTYIFDTYQGDICLQLLRDVLQLCYTDS